MRFSIKAILGLIFAVAIVSSRFQPREISAEISVSQESPHHAPLITLTNTGDNDIWFEGYSETTALGDVVYFINDSWIPLRVGICGTGLERRRLKPAASVRVDVIAGVTENQDAWRFTVVCFDGENADSRSKTVLSHVIQRPAT
jgi:hypothetical protein